METFNELISFRAYKEDRNDLVKVAQQCQLEEAEVARRALRLGLEVLRDFKMPGVRDKRGARE